MRAAGPSAVSGHCVGHCGESRAPSGDHARRSPFRSLWTLRREPGPQRRPRAPQPLLQSPETVPAIAERAGPPAATTRAAAPSAISGDCSGHCGDSRAPSGDHARRSPFCSLWTLRREPGPQRRPRAPQPLLQSPKTAPATAERAGPQRRPRAPQALLQSLDTAPATAERAGPPAATTRAAAPSAVSGHCAGHSGESRAPSGDHPRRSPFSLWTLRRPLRREPGLSGDHARRSPFCSLWTLRRPLRREPGPQRRPRAPQPLLQSLDTAPATPERAGPPAATTRAAAPSVSGHCAGHYGESRAPSGDHARRSPFWRLWVLRLPRGLPAAPVATTRAAAPSGGSGYCACHEDCQRQVSE